MPEKAHCRRQVTIVLFFTHHLGEPGPASVKPHKTAGGLSKSNSKHTLRTIEIGTREANESQSAYCEGALGRHSS